MTSAQRRTPLATNLVASLAIALCSTAGWAQTACSSDGVAAPGAMLERLISADCAHCWTDANTRKPDTGTVVLDWIAPGKEGDDAPLSAASLRDAVWRLQALHRQDLGASVTTSVLTRVKPPVRAASAVASANASTPDGVAPAPVSLRVAHGPAVNDYIGTSIALTVPSHRAREVAQWQAWLVLVESVQAGVEQTAVDRNLVRNSLQHRWNIDNLLLKSEQITFAESRPMRIASQAREERLRVIGWVNDAEGNILAVAESRCARDGPAGS